MNVSLWNVFNALYCIGDLTCEYLWRAYCMSLWHGTGAKPDGNDGGASQRRQVFAHPNMYCHSLCKLLKCMTMFTKSLVHELKSTEISIMIPLQKGHNDRCALSVNNVIQNGFSLCELTWLKCIRPVLFLFKILNRNRIMYGRKKEAHWPSISSTHTFNFYSADCPPVEASCNSMSYSIISACSCDSTRYLDNHLRLKQKKQKKNTIKGM